MMVVVVMGVDRGEQKWFHVHEWNQYVGSKPESEGMRDRRERQNERRRRIESPQAADSSFPVPWSDLRV